MTSSTNNKNISFKNQVMPTECIFLWIALAVAVPLTIATIASIGVPIMHWVEGFLSTVNPEMLENEFSLPKIPLSLIAFSLLGVIISLGLFVSIQAKYINNWSLAADKRNIFKQQPFVKSVFALSIWVIYRVFYIFSPVVIMLIISFGLMFGSIKFFNFIAKMMGINLESVIIVGIFVALTTAFFWLVAIVSAIWNTLTSVYGSNIAIMEPDTSCSLIRKRSRRFAFLTSTSWGAYIVYVFMMCVVFMELLFLLINSSFISINNILTIGFIECINIFFFIALGRALTFSYYKSLLIQFAKISVKKSKILSSRNSSSSSITDNFSTSMI